MTPAGESVHVPLWYAVHTRSNHEKVVADSIAARELEVPLENSMDSEGEAMQTQALKAAGDSGSIVSASNAHWYAVHTYPQNEKKVATELQQKGIEIFLPLITEIHQWSDRKKRVDVPLFPGYLFVRMIATLENCVRVLHTWRVLRLLGSQKNVPTPIPDSEIESTRLLAARNVNLFPHAFSGVGQKVRVYGGCLDGVEGIVVGRGNDSHLVVSINLIQQAVALSLYGYRVEPI